MPFECHLNETTVISRKNGQKTMCAKWVMFKFEVERLQTQISAINFTWNTCVALTSVEEHARHTNIQRC